MRMRLLHRLTSFTLLLVGLIAFSQLADAQQVWYYHRAIGFPVSDTAYVRLYAMTVDSRGNIWVISSTATDTTAHNSVWEADPQDTVFKKIVDFGSYYDSSSSSYFDKNVGALTGVAALGQTIYLSGDQPSQLTQSNTVAFIYVLRNGSLTDSLHLGYGMRGSGFGTFINCIQVSSDSIAFVGCPYDPNHVGPSWRAYNMTSGPIIAYDKNGVAAERPFGAYLFGDPSYAYSGYYSPAPGGPAAGGTNVILSLALIPGMNYADSANAIRNSYFFTSRSSGAGNPGTGGIAVWTGGYDRQPALYTAKQVTDIAGYLSLGTYAYYGITADSAGDLFVCRGDSGYDCVKIFQVIGTFATEIGSLPSRTDPNNPNPNGAPFAGPTAVSLSPDQQTAYVADRVARKIFVFSTSLTGVDERPQSQPYRFHLNQNYPNPFNPSTLISYELRSNGRVDLQVFNILGQEVATLVDGVESAGVHSVLFDGSKLSSGVYFYTLENGPQRVTKKMILIK